MTLQEGTIIKGFKCINVLRSGDNKSPVWLLECLNCKRTSEKTEKFIRNNKPKCVFCTQAAKKLNDALPFLGKKYGFLLVKELSTERGLRKAYHFKCECICGKIIEVSRHNLKNGHTRSCGCMMGLLTREIRSGWKGENALLTRIHETYVRNAKGRKLEWSLTDETFLKLIKEPCWYCDKYSKTIEKYGFKVRISGIDRIDSSIGYTDSNTIPCCKNHNLAKQSLNSEEFEDLIVSAAIFRFKEKVLKIIRE